MKDDRLDTAIRTIQTGGIIAYPTESVYGLGCNPFDEHAVTRLLSLKRRQANKGLVLIAANFSQVEALIGTVPQDIIDKVKADWPGPVNYLLPASHRVPTWIKGDHDSVALRLSAHPIAQRLCELAGHTLVSTSANRQAEPPARTAMELAKSFEPQEIDYIIDAPTGGLESPCPIFDAMTGRQIRA